MSEKPQSSHTFNTLALLGVIGGKAEKLGGQARGVPEMALSLQQGDEDTKYNDDVFERDYNG